MDHIKLILKCASISQSSLLPPYDLWFLRVVFSSILSFDRTITDPTQPTSFEPISTLSGDMSLSRAINIPSRLCCDPLQTIPLHLGQLF